MGLQLAHNHPRNGTRANTSVFRAAIRLLSRRSPFSSGGRSSGSGLRSARFRRVDILIASGSGQPGPVDLLPASTRDRPRGLRPPLRTGSVTAYRSECRNLHQRSASRTQRGPSCACSTAANPCCAASPSSNEASTSPSRRPRRQASTKLRIIRPSAWGWPS